MEYQRLTISFVLLVATIIFGTFGYRYLEGMPLFDSFYMTLITISTVGFSELKPLSQAGRLVTVIIITFGISIGTYTIGLLVKIFVEGEIQKLLGRRKLERLISGLKEHFIVCGFGRIGTIISEELNEENRPFIVIEQDDEKIDILEKKGYLYLNMDATSEDALLKAGIMQAKGLVTVVSSDADNVYITLTAKGLKPDVFILARASDDKSEQKLKRAGATRVVSPYHIGARRMAQVLKRPTVVDFLDTATMESDLGLIIDELVIGRNSDLIGKNLIESSIRQSYGVIIVAIKKESGEMVFNPAPTERLSGGDVIVVLGKKESLRRMGDIL